MISYVNIGTNDLARAKSFYDAILAPLGARILLSTNTGYLYTNDKGPMLVINLPYDGKPATVGNGSMVALSAPSRELVNEIHARALELGGQDEGAPGPRSDEDDFYGAYFRDLDGNKLAVCCWQV